MDAASLSDEELVDEVTTWGARVARGEARHLQLIAELDAREAWAVHGVTSCAGWLSWKLGWSTSTANERVRVGRALRVLPLVATAFAAGRLSYSQVRAITRIATPDDEANWVELARYGTGAQLDRAARGAARARAADQDPADRPAKQPARVDWDEDGDLVLTLRIPAHQAVPVLAALEQHQATEQAERDATLAALMTEVVDASAPDPTAGLTNQAHDVTASAEAAPARALTVPTPQTPAEAPAPDPTAGPTNQARDVTASAEAAPAGPARALSVPAPRTPAEVATAVDLTAVPEAAYLDPLEHFPYTEPPYPIRSDRFGCGLTDAEREAITLWETLRNKARAVRDAWNTRREALLLIASTQRVAVGRASLADALVRLVTNPAGCAPVTVQLLTDPLSAWARTQHDELLPPAAVQQLVGAFSTRWASRGPVPLELSCHDQGRRTRLVTPAQRRLLGQLDGERCRFPGCRRTKNLHAHHIRYWRHGGTTDLANLVLLCGKHHRLLHDNGYELTLHPDRTLAVRTPEGTLLAHQPELVAASAEALPPAGPDTLPPTCMGDRLDLGYVVNVMLAHAA